jgi:acyl carrier protein
MRDEIRNKIQQLLQDHSTFTDNDSLVTSGRLNSLKIVELASWIELQYGIDFGEKGFNIYDFDTVSSIVALIVVNETRK